MERKEREAQIALLEASRQQQVLSCLLFPESFVHILEECKQYMNEAILVSIITELIHKNLAFAVDAENGRRLLYFDKDNMHNYLFQASAKGLDTIK